MFRALEAEINEFFPLYSDHLSNHHAGQVMGGTGAYSVPSRPASPDHMPQLKASEEILEAMAFSVAYPQ